MTIEHERKETLAQLDILIGHISGFYEEADKAGVRDARLAMLAARDAGLIDDRGRVDMAALKRKHPSLFDEQPLDQTREAREARNMNEFIRRAGGQNTRVKDINAFLRRNGYKGGRSS